MQGITRSLLDVMATKASLPVRRAGTQVLSQMPGARISRNYSNPTRYRSLAVRRNVRRNKAFDLKPSLEVANAMPNSPPEMDNGTLVTLAWLGNFHACSEMLIRNIMQVDKVDYDTAIKTFDLIAAKNREGMFLLALPYQIGITAALVAGFGSLPMVFSLPVAEWFNQYYVTTDVPEPQDLETMLEIGSWTWNWMEPPLGTISFALLCLQYSRAQLENLGIKPYTSKLKSLRGERLAKAFPKYDARLIMAFSVSDKLYK